MLSQYCNISFSGGENLFAVISALFFMGLMGGVFHCAFMCGPFVATQVNNTLSSDKSAHFSEFTRLKGALLLPYHLGRITTYVLLGALIASIAGGVQLAWQGVTSWLLLVAGILIILSVLPNNTKLIPLKFTKLTNLLSKITLPFMKNPTGKNGYFLGVLLGLLPCGMLYAAFSAAAATASPLYGSLAMLAFALGTVPALFATGLFSAMAVNSIKSKTQVFTKGATALSGIWLCAIALTKIL
jgi:uncharacterized protein